MITRQIRLARRVTEWLWEDDRFEVLPKSDIKEEALAKTFIIVLFRAKDEETNTSLVKSINATGKMYVSGTVWEGKSAARIAISNWRVDVEKDSKLIEEVLGGI